jgi:PhzF family phenazine biosynthesis protein
VLFNHLDYEGEQVIFSSMSGELRVARANGRLILDFPASPPVAVETPEDLIKGLGMRPKEVHKSRDYLALFENEAEILSIEPNFDILKQLDCLGIIITAEGKNCDFVSKFFAPAAGINEDPVTGSAHTTLIPFWAERLKKNVLHAFQLSQRKGELFCELAGKRVKVGGHAVTFFKGEIVL